MLSHLVNLAFRQLTKIGSNEEKGADLCERMGASVVRRIVKPTKVTAQRMKEIEIHPRLLIPLLIDIVFVLFV